MGLVGKLRPRYLRPKDFPLFVNFSGSFSFPNLPSVITKTGTHSKTRRNKGDVEVLVCWELLSNGKS